MILWDVEQRVAIGHPLRTASTAFAKDLDLSADGLVVASVQGPEWCCGTSTRPAGCARRAPSPTGRFTDQERAQYLGGRQPVADGCDGEP